MTYKGCMAPNNIPKTFFNTNKEQYPQCCIANTTTEGEHWIALYKNNNGKTYIFDSFGRNSQELSHFYDPKWIPTDTQHEQAQNTTNCGYHSVTFLECVDLYGIENCIKVL